VLAEEGYEVTVEKTDDGGLSRAKADLFDVVVTDLKLSGLSGLELVRELHATRPRLAILMMTAQSSAIIFQFLNMTRRARCSSASDGRRKKFNASTNARGNGTSHRRKIQNAFRNAARQNFFPAPFSCNGI